MPVDLINETYREGKKQCLYIFVYYPPQGPFGTRNLFHLNENICFNKSPFDQYNSVGVSKLLH